MRGMCRARPHMLAHHAGRHEQRRVPLNIGPLDRVHAVGRPHAAGEFEYAQVDTAAARCATLNLQSRMRDFEVTEHPVHGERLPVNRRPAGTWRDRLGDEFVVVPFDVVDAQLADQRIDGIMDVSVGVGIGQVEHLLRASLHRQTVRRRAQHPVRVGASRRARMWSLGGSRTSRHPPRTVRHRNPRPYRPEPSTCRSHGRNTRPPTC